MADDLQAQLEKRREWFCESQLRRLNMDSFAGINAETTDGAERTLLNLVTERAVVAGVPPENAPLVYLDNQQPVWTADERERRNTLAAGYIGRRCDWLAFKEPRRIIQMLSVLSEASEKDRFASISLPPDPSGSVFLPRRKDAMSDENGQAIARAMIAEAKPWLLPELYHPNDVLNHNGGQRNDLEPWFQNLEQLLADIETELSIDTGGSPTDRPPFDRKNAEAYRAWIRSAMQRQVKQELTSDSTVDQRRAFVDTVKVEFLQKIRPPKPKTKPRLHPKAPGVLHRPGEYNENVFTYKFDITVEAKGVPPVSASVFPQLAKARYWNRVINNPLKEVYANKPDSDMGLVTLIRTLYLFGTIPETVASGDALRWRKPKFPEDEFNEFFARRTRDKRFWDQPELFQRLADAQTKLRIILEARVEFPGAASIAFSPIIGRVLREGLHHYKFWLDEPMRAMTNTLLQKARTDLGLGDAEAEMEYWSENHYLMFASSEYLAGQLWEFDEFHPGKAFGQTDGIMSGSRRKERGKARLLKWLNHRLMFGWAEFNSSGYYREHLWSLLNLVDFSMDAEVREKATVATDLLLFDVARYQHRGAMGAAGGRSQFKSKASGWDNSLGDAVEMLFGTRGMFCDGDSLIGAAMASTTYKVPDVLLEIGANPPQTTVVDRSRVSITFDEAYKYGIWFSQESDETTSRRDGYAPKLERHFPFVKTVNDAINTLHTGYGPHEDSIVFWWSTSSFVNQQVVRKSLEYVEQFGLEESGIWAKLPNVLTTYVPLAKGLGFGGFFYGGVEGTARFLGGLGPIGGLLELTTSDIEQIADEFAVLLDGSSRTRANILTYSTGDVMLSSIQNFRAGQLNYQSNVNQVTMNRALNVFTTSGFAGLDLAPLTVAAAGFLTPLGPIGSAIALGVELGQEGSNVFGDEGDGPSWWTGYLALPMVVQHRGASIIIYQFDDIQETLAETQSHAWFPKNGFDTTAANRTSAYEDDNSIFPGANGHWLFGKITHPVEGVPAADYPEAYVGVFSNEEPEWLTAHEDHDADVYAPTIETKRENPSANLPEDVKKRWPTIWKDPLPRDYFADKDWNADGKNIWIIQVGSKAEFGDFEQFKARVTSAKVVVDDAGDLECTYHMPLPLTEGGGSQALKLDYDDADFTIDGAALQTDLYPRFENPYIRGQNDFPVNNAVEWGQRSYVIAYRNKALLHDFHDFTAPVRTEDKIPPHKSLSSAVRAFVMFARTGEEEMEEFTNCVAAVTFGCATVASDEIVAVGPVGEDTSHDAEWIFLGAPTQLSPDLTIELAHKAYGDGDDEAEWDVSFSLKALMADHRLVDCELSRSSVSFTEDTRRSGPMLFTVKTDVWHPWQRLADSQMTGAAVLVKRPSWKKAYYDHCDVLVVAPEKPVRHRRVHACINSPALWSEIPRQPGDPAFGAATTVQAFSRAPGSLEAFAISGNRLFSTSADNVAWSPWTARDALAGSTPLPVPFASPGSLYAAPSVLSGLGFVDAGAELVATGSNGHLYANFAWQPGGTGLWRQLRVNGFELRQDGDCVMAKERLFVLDTDGALWAADIVRFPNIPTDPFWKKVSPPGVALENFTAVDTGEEPDPAATVFPDIVSASTRLLAVSKSGQLWDVTVPEVQPSVWEPLAAPVDHPLPQYVRIAYAAAVPDRLDIFITVGEIAYTQMWNKSGWHGWKPVVEGGQGFRAADRNPLVVHRVNRQVELLVETLEGDLMRTWWS